jgi:hypothetical protein
MKGINMCINGDEEIEMLEITISELTLWVMKLTGWDYLEPVADGLPDKLHEYFWRGMNRAYGNLD